VQLDDQTDVVARRAHDRRAAIGEIVDLVLRAVILFFAIFVVTRVVVRHELSTMEPFDLILLIVTGDLLQPGVTQNDYSLTGALTVIATIALLTVALSYVSFKACRGCDRCPRANRWCSCRTVRSSIATCVANASRSTSCPPALASTDRDARGRSLRRPGDQRRDLLHPD
jgi:hypothetical protein